MSKQLGPLEIVCDAPPYKIVQACSQLGFRTPEDVRWCRLSCFLLEHVGWREVLQFLSWEVLAREGRLGGRTCSCHKPLPQLDKYTFLLTTGRELSYFLGQCEGCRTIFWENA